MNPRHLSNLLFTWLCICLLQGNAQELAPIREVYKKGKFEEATLLYRQAISALIKISRWDTLAVARKEYAHALIKLSDYELAELQLDTAIKEWEIHLPGKGAIYAGLMQEKGNVAQEQYFADDALRFHREALKGRLKYKAPLNELAESYEGVGMDYFFFENDLDSASWFIDQALRARQRLSKPDSLSLGYTHNTLGMLASRRLNPNEALGHFLETERHLRNKLDSLHPNWVMIYSNIGGTYVEKGNYDLASQYLNRALRQAKDNRQKFGLYFNLAALKVSQGDLDQAGALAAEAYRLAEGLVPELDPRRTNLENLLGAIALDQNHPRLALTHYRRGMDIVRHLSGDNEADIGQCYFNMSTVWKALGNSDSALSYIRRSAQIRKADLGTDNNRTGDSYGEWAEQLLAMGKFTEAGELFQQCLGMYQASLSPTHPHLAWSRAMLAEINLNQGNIHEGLLWVSEGWKPFLVGDGPVPKSVNIPANTYFLDLFAVQSKLYWVEYQDNKSYLSLIHSLEASQQGVALVRQIRNQIGSESSRSAVVSQATPLFDQGITAAYELYALTCEEKWVDIALKLAAENKAVILAEALQQQRALQFSGIPDSLLKEEARIRTDISFFEQRLMDGAATEAADRVQLFQTKQAYQALQDRLKQEFPRYYQTRFQPIEVSVQEVRKQLGRVGGSLVEYLPVNEDWYALVVSPDTASLVFLGKIPALADSLASLQLAMESNKPRQFALLSQLLYQKLWAPLAGLVQSKEVVIVPGGSLSYLSFDLLLCSQPGKAAQWGNWDYLLKHHSLSYAYATSLLADFPQKARSLPSKSLLAIAPGFDDSLKVGYRATCNSGCDSVFDYRLRQPWASRTAQELAEKWKGTSLLGLAATESNYLGEANAYQILHFGTHAEVNDSLPLLSYLALALPDSAADGYLHTAELYNKDLNNELVVLTACQTGRGVWSEGQGVLSLAWGFRHAGCPAMVMSLWSIDDQQSASIIAHFYELLKKRKAKNSALQTAKLAYLESAKGEAANPYYWAGLVLSGNATPLEQGIRWGLWLAGMVLAAAIASLVLLFRKKLLS